MRYDELALLRGLQDTRATLEEWRRTRWRVVGDWTVAALAVATGLLCGIYLIAKVTPPDPTPVAFPGLATGGTAADVGFLLYRNSLVLALHAFACAAGFIAGSSLPLAAAQRSRAWRLVHDKAGRAAIWFVVLATAFSLATQAYALGSGVSTLAAQLGLAPEVLLVALLPHALPELTALFLPLAAWLIASRRGEWHKLLAATFVTVAIAVPVLVAAALVEVYLTPTLLLALAA